MCGTELAALTLLPYPGLVACSVWDACKNPSAIITVQCWKILVFCRHMRPFMIHLPFNT